MVHNPTAKHRNIIWIQAETHEVLPSGECSGSPVYKVARFPITFDGEDKDIAIRVLNEFLEEVKKK
jgi:hypothetical protein